MEIPKNILIQNNPDLMKQTVVEEKENLKCSEKDNIVQQFINTPEKGKNLIDTFNNLINQR